MYMIAVDHPVSLRRFTTHEHAADVADAFGIDPAHVRQVEAPHVQAA